MTLYEELALYLRFTETQVRTLPTRISSATSSREEIKSKRIKFTEQQRTALELEYRKEPYIGAIRKAELAEEFSVPQRALQGWFQNCRKRDKKSKLLRTRSNSICPKPWMGYTSSANNTAGPASGSLHDQWLHG
ncbi:homeobox even-skipped homolog protein 1-like [Rhynchophorus ferrugineus]|uniref:homeobox even-skipped homolog protein 1-like n=1 Tax=Rhynchophorus ferrugineus TaxID=354439 RepID=UPI003FCE8687